MATVGGLSTSTSGSIRGYGGLASGLDRDTLIEGMTMGTTNKITQQQQKQQKLEWKQAAVQNITSKLLDFANKYTSSWSSSTNLFSSVFWGRNKITTSGVNSKFISVSGSGTSAQNVKIMGVKQLAQKATWSTAKGVSDSTLKTGDVDFEDWHNLRNRDLVFEVDGKSYTVTLPEKNADGTRADYSDAEKVRDAIDAQLNKIKLKGPDGKDTTENLASKVEVKFENNGITFAGKGTGSVKLAGGDAIGVLGFTSTGLGEDGKYDISPGKSVSVKEDSMKLKTAFNERIAGQELRFSYNGSAVSVYMPSAADLQKEAERILSERTDAKGNSVDVSNENEAKLVAIKDSLQKQLDSAFGKNRVEVSVSSDKKGLEFKTVKPSNGEIVDDTSSTLSITGGNMDLVNNVLNTRVGESNRVNLSASLSQAGFAGLTADMFDKTKTDYIFTEKETIKVKDADGNETTKTLDRATIEINGTKVAIYATDTMNSLMERINANTDVKVTYQAETDKFVFTSKEDGASGKIEIKGAVADPDGNIVGSNDPDVVEKVNGLLDGLFGVGKLNQNVKLSEAGFVGITDNMFTGKETVDGKEKKYANISINGTQVKVYEDDTINTLMKRINKVDGVNVTYDAEADKLVFTSTKNPSEKINIDGSTDLEKQLVNSLFESSERKRGTVYGQDAIIAVKYAGSDEVVEINRGTNSFTMDGLTVNVKGEFGYKEVDGEVVRDTTTEEIEIDAQVDADSIVNAVKAMVEEYNSIIELVHKEVSTKPDRDYSPLTSEQKKELDEDEIKTWEKKAKEGILYADSDIRGLSSDLRFIIDGGIAQELSEMGLSTSSSYSDNGKLVFDETKFRAALAKDPERVQEIFANESVTNTNKNGTSTGIATRLKNVLDKYVNTTGSMDTKGILIRKAGHESSPMSVTENTMYKQLDSIKKKITELQERLETERDRYIKQFTSLETLISQMNSQSSWLSQFGGY